MLLATINISACCLLICVIFAIFFSVILAVWIAHMPPPRRKTVGSGIAVLFLCFIGYTTSNLNIRKCDEGEVAASIVNKFYEAPVIGDVLALADIQKPCDCCSDNP